MKKYIFLALVFVLSFFAFSTNSQTTLSVAPSVCFNRNLSFGARGEDVRQLQIMLNKDTATQVAASNGAGSPGRETTFFGPSTGRAVVKFQEKHGAEVLVPAGLKKGTGFVGALTRAKLNQMSGCGQIPTPTPVPTPIPNQVRVDSIAPSVGVKGTVVTVTGIFPATGNTVKFDEYVAASNVTSNGTSLTFTVPDGGGVYCAPGMACIQIYKIFNNATYQLSVANGNVTSNSRAFTISAPPQNIISVISPNGGEYWSRGSIQAIRWDYAPVTAGGNANFEIKLVNVPQPCPSSTQCTSVVPAPYTIVSTQSTTYSWNVGTSLDTTRYIPAGLYKIQVCLADGSVCGVTNGVFTIQ
jgi:peptidoglycan hydrolase-like protein with peptidoglycan-binding domain